VYSALVIALVQPSLEYSVLAMALFGLATIPALFIFTGSAKLIQQVLPISINSLQRITLVAVAVLMIWRGVAFAFPDVIPGSEILCHS
jgi:sulfite exporter TauE/SafE